MTEYLAPTGEPNRTSGTWIVRRFSVNFKAFDNEMTELEFESGPATVSQPCLENPSSLLEGDLFFGIVQCALV